jgi:hypothetical protein
VWRGQYQPSALLHQHENSDLDYLIRRELSEHCRGCQSRLMNLESGLEAISQEVDQHVHVGPMLELVIDGPNAQRLFRERKALSIYVNCP